MRGYGSPDTLLTFSGTKADMVARADKAWYINDVAVNLSPYNV